LGRAILGFVEAQARKFGAILLTLETESNNENQQRKHARISAQVRLYTSEAARDAQTIIASDSQPVLSRLERRKCTTFDWLGP
jgi:hypothetical protein